MIKIFVVEDDLVYGKLIERALKIDNIEITIFQNGQEFLDNLHLNPDIVTLDYSLPDMKGIEILKKIVAYNPDISTILLSGQDELNVVVEVYKLGAKSYIIKNENAIVELNNCIKNLITSLNLKKEVEHLRDELIDRNKYSHIIGNSPEIFKVLMLIQKVENSDILTLVTGKSGTGKELVAQAIHDNSPRKNKPFIAVNVAAIPADLIESELFGHEKGAFTGATGKRKGKFEEANGGTIFLDEIAEMDINLQTKLLRVLQDNKISKLGSNKIIKLDLRIIAATNKSLGERVKEGKFREDLYYRIQGFLINLPPLRERGNDIIILANYFLEDYSKKNKIEAKSLDNEAKTTLLNHPWTGNVRELKSVIERTFLICETDVIGKDDIVFSDAI